LAFDKDIIILTVLVDFIRLSLDCYGICGAYLEWIKEFLTDRTQQVAVYNKFSTSSPVISGVPKESVLGPSTFCCLSMTYIPCNIDSVVKFYADDVLMYGSINTYHQ